MRHEGRNDAEVAQFFPEDCGGMGRNAGVRGALAICLQLWHYKKTSPRGLRWIFFPSDALF